METAEQHNLQKRSFRIGGMTCVHCQNKIEKKLKNTAGVQAATVNYHTGTAVVTYDAGAVGFDKISAVIEKLGYRILEENSKNTLLHIIGTLVIILALFMLIRTFGTSRLAAIFPLAQEGMSYGMLLIIGILTSVHCIAMCGGINLSQTLRKREEEESAPQGTFSLLLPSTLYNGGRLVSYTAVGVLVGALGSVITVSGRFQGAIQLVAGIFMMIMGINMLGLFPALRRFSPHIPKIFAQKIDERKTGRGPLIVGFLNGFMPCGPLQAMQLYALSTGSPIRGGISMFLFCIGTIPPMFALGTAGSVLSGAKGRAFSRRVMYAGAVLVAALGLVMFSSGWTLSGFANPPDKTASIKTADAPKGNPGNNSPRALQDQRQTQPPPNTANAAPDSKPFVPVIENGVQIVKSTLRPNRYPAITVQQGIPVHWTINAPPGSITGCNYTAIFYEYDIEHVFQQGDNVIEFTPTKAGKFRYSCWMGMIKSTITVIAEAEKEG
jgi:sulfite exporter TauE/SafE/copper chaperone CopZ